MLSLLKLNLTTTISIRQCIWIRMLIGLRREEAGIYKLHVFINGCFLVSVFCYPSGNFCYKYSPFHFMCYPLILLFILKNLYFLITVLVLNHISVISGRQWDYMFCILFQVVMVQGARGLKLIQIVRCKRA